MATFMLVHGLVHGAYQGGWIWKPVAARLCGAGHIVYAPTLDGCAERHHQVRPGITVATQAEEMAELLFCEDLTDVVLVGTSSGGMVICRTAERAGPAARSRFSVGPARRGSCRRRWSGYWPDSGSHTPTSTPLSSRSRSSRPCSCRPSRRSDWRAGLDCSTPRC